MELEFSAIAIAASAASAFVSAVSAALAIFAYGGLKRTLKSKEKPVPPGPDVEETSTESIEIEEVDP